MKLHLPAFLLACCLFSAHAAAVATLSSMHDGSDLHLKDVSAELDGRVVPNSLLVTVGDEACEIYSNNNGSLAGATGLTKQGAGTLTIRTQNTATGTLLVDAGTVYLNGGSWLGGVQVNEGGTLHLELKGLGSNTTIQSAGKVILEDGNDLACLSGGALEVRGDVAVDAVGSAGLASVALGADSSLAVGGAGDVRIGQLSGEGDFKTTHGNVVLGSASSIAGKLTVGGGHALTVTDCLSVGSLVNVSTITLRGDLSAAPAAISVAEGVNSARLAFVVEDGRSLSDLNLGVGATYTLMEAGSMGGSLALGIALGGESARRFVIVGDKSYVIGSGGGNRVLLTVGTSDNDWMSTDGTWGSGSVVADWKLDLPDEQLSADFIGGGTGAVQVVGPQRALAIHVDSGAKHYSFSGDAVTAGSLLVEGGGLTIGNAVEVLADSSKRGWTGKATVDVAGGLTVTGSLMAESMELLADNALDNRGSTQVQGALEAGGREVRNTGDLRVGSGSDIGTLVGAGSFVAQGNAHVGLVDGARSLAATDGASLAVGSVAGGSIKGISVASGSAVSVAGDGVLSIGSLTGGAAGRFSAPNAAVTLGSASTAGLDVRARSLNLVSASGSVFGTVQAQALTLGMGGASPDGAALLRAERVVGSDISLTLEGVGELLSAGMEPSLAGRYLLIDQTGASVEELDVTLTNEEEIMEAFAASGRYVAFLVLSDGDALLEVCQVPDFYRGRIGGRSQNGDSGLSLLDDVASTENPQARAPQGDVARVLDTLDNYVYSNNAEAAETLASAVAGSGVAAAGSAALGDLDRQLRAMRNRLGGMEGRCGDSRRPWPHVNTWILAEGDRRELDAHGTRAGYTLSSWGGTLGADAELRPGLACGMALTAMYGDFDAKAQGSVSGGLDSCYLSAVARLDHRVWQHSFVMALGCHDLSLDRSVYHGMGSYRTQGSTDGHSFGLLYEVSRPVRMDGDGRAMWQPLANVQYRHVGINGYTERGSDAALRFGGQTLDMLSFGAGAGMQRCFGHSFCNRSLSFEGRALLKFDMGDRASSADVAFATMGSHRAHVKGADVGSFGLELGAGLTLPLGRGRGSVFADATLELRADYTNVNGTVGYRISF